MATIKETLEAEAPKLAALVADPHPGLVTWCEAVIRATTRIAATLPAHALQRLADEAFNELIDSELEGPSLPPTGRQE